MDYCILRVKGSPFSLQSVSWDYSGRKLCDHHGHPWQVGGDIVGSYYECSRHGLTLPGLVNQYPLPPWILVVEVNKPPNWSRNMVIDSLTRIFPVTKLWSDLSGDLLQAGRRDQTSVF